MLQKKTFLPFLLYCILILCSCSAKETSSTPAGNNNSISAEPETTKPEPPVYLEYEVSDTENLYELTPILEIDSEITLCSYAMYDEENILLIYQDINYGDEPFFFARIWNIKTGKHTTPIESWQALTGDNTFIWHQMDVLSVNPLVIYDDANFIIYQPGNKNEAIPLTEEMLGGTVHYINGNIYVAAGDNRIYTLTDDGIFQQIWSLPSDYSWMYASPTPGADSIILSACPLRNENTPNVYMTWTPDQGITESYTIDLDHPFSDPFHGCGNYFCYTEYDVAGKLHLLNPETEKLMTLDFQPILNGDEILDMNHLSVSGNYCVFHLMDSGYLTQKLYLWDFSKSEIISSGYPEKIPFEESIVDYADLTRRTEAIDVLYDVTIVIGENIEISYPGYETVPETNLFHISNALDVIEDTLALYPTDFFSQIQELCYRDIVIYLTGPITGTDTTSYIASASGLTFENSDMEFMALEAEFLTPGTLIHEITHVVDDYLLMNGSLSDEEWHTLNPEGFDYYYAYVDENGTEYSFSGSDEYTSYSDSYFYGDMDSVYFLDSYAKTFPTEDRARLMEMFLGSLDYLDDCYQGQPIQQKLEFYFTCIRNGFDTSDWPEQTSWETALNNLKN